MKTMSTGLRSFCVLSILGFSSALPARLQADEGGDGETPYRDDVGDYKSTPYTVFKTGHLYLKTEVRNAAGDDEEFWFIYDTGTTVPAMFMSKAAKAVGVQSGGSAEMTLGDLTVKKAQVMVFDHPGLARVRGCSTVT